MAARRIGSASLQRLLGNWQQPESRTPADQIMVVNGAVSGFTLLLRLFTGPGDRVIIEHPTYPHAIGAIKGAACRPISVALPDQGGDTDGLAITIAQAAPRLASPT